MRLTGSHVLLTGATGTIGSRLATELARRGARLTVVARHVEALTALATRVGGAAVAADLTDTDGFADNVNVVLSPAGEVSAEQVEGAGVTELENAGATDVEANDRVVVAGAESAHLSANLSASGTSYAVEQYYVTDEGQTYVVTFSFSPTVDDDQREAVAESVLASWAWA